MTIDDADDRAFDLFVYYVFIPNRAKANVLYLFCYSEIWVWLFNFNYSVHTMTVIDAPSINESERQHFSTWGEELVIPEWDESSCFRSQHGWKVRLLLRFFSV